MANLIYGGTKSVQQMYNDKPNNIYYQLYPITTSENIKITDSLNLNEIFNIDNSIVKLFNRFLAIQPVSICTTSHDTTIKTITINDFILENGSRILIKFTNSNTANNVKLKINNLEEKNITINGQPLEPSLIQNGLIYELIYDGLNFEVINNISSVYNTYDGGNASLFKSTIFYGGSSTVFDEITENNIVDGMNSVNILTLDEIVDGYNSSRL